MCRRVVGIWSAVGQVLGPHAGGVLWRGKYTEEIMNPDLTLYSKKSSLQVEHKEENHSRLLQHTLKETP